MAVNPVINFGELEKKQPILEKYKTADIKMGQNSRFIIVQIASFF